MNRRIVHGLCGALFGAALLAAGPAFAHQTLKSDASPSYVHYGKGHGHGYYKRHKRHRGHGYHRYHYGKKHSLGSRHWKKRRHWRYHGRKRHYGHRYKRYGYPYYPPLKFFRYYFHYR